MARPLIGALSVLLALLGTFSAVVGSAASAAADEDRTSVATVPARVAPESSVADAPAGAVLSPRLQCQPGEHPPQQLEKRRITAPVQEDRAAIRRLVVDQLEWVQPGFVALSTPDAVAADISGPARGAVQHASHRTFDGRAPPVSS